MSIDRGPDLPTDGRQDERQFIRCSACKRLAKCYRGPELASVTDEHGNVWQHWTYWCNTCMAVVVGEALRQSENDAA
jgi:hypothetical protein